MYLFADAFVKYAFRNVKAHMLASSSLDLNFVQNIPATEKALSDSTLVGRIVKRYLYASDKYFCLTLEFE